MPEVRTRRIGHKGADHIAPGNTLASFDAALAHGVDMIEFDVLSENIDGTGRLLLAHDYGVAAERKPLDLDEGLAHFAGAAFDGVDLDLDMKIPGYEQRVVDALRKHGLAERTLISTMEVSSLKEIRRLAPEIRLGWSVPKVRKNYLAHPATRPFALLLVAYARRAFPRRLAAAIQRGEVEAIMAHWALVTPAFWAAIQTAGGELYVWTVDDAEQIAKFEAMGVTGVISNDPRLFG